MHPTCRRRCHRTHPIPSDLDLDPGPGPLICSSSSHHRRHHRSHGWTDRPCPSRDSPHHHDRLCLCLYLDFDPPSRPLSVPRGDLHHLGRHHHRNGRDERRSRGLGLGRFYLRPWTDF